ncbi:unnamed protein product [Soboliphyme baturini]|uniref:FGGY_N domain-containing protein n=1 Tax=Soboliphyme baturini TaxID=241478 RepID=A0A183J0R1_9BILA|nr:unnamed protein product [Soboliphyme baturini]
MQSLQVDRRFLHRQSKQMNIVLGIDLGTTSVKVVLYRFPKILSQCCLPHEATISSEDKSFHQQDVAKIFAAFERCVKSVLLASPINMQSVSAIAVCGQMHGCVLWAERDIHRFTTAQQAICALASGDWSEISPLVTWLDRRAVGPFLDSLPLPKSHVVPRSGFGIVTLLWWLRNGMLPGPSSACNCAGTVQDLLVACLCLLQRPVMTNHNAVSWGYFDDVNSFSWNESLLEREGLQHNFLPEVVSAGSIAGFLKGSFHGILDGVPVFAALGDFQATVYQHMCPHTAVAASLNGGNVLSAIVDSLCDAIFMITGSSPPAEKVWQVLMTDVVSTNHQEVSEDSCSVNPWLFGERYDPSLRASVTNITSGNFSLSRLFQEVISSIISNLHSMLPAGFIEVYDIRQMKLTGEAAKDYFRKFVEKFYGDRCQITAIEGTLDAAVGSAAYVSHISSSCSSERV